jgi:hypothetical protein
MIIMVLQMFTTLYEPDRRCGVRRNGPGGYGTNIK